MRKLLLASAALALMSAGVAHATGDNLSPQINFNSPQIAGTFLTSDNVTGAITVSTEAVGNNISSTVDSTVPSISKTPSWEPAYNTSDIRAAGLQANIDSPQVAVTTVLGGTNTNDLTVDTQAIGNITNYSTVNGSITGNEDLFALLGGNGSSLANTVYNLGGLSGQVNVGSPQLAVTDINDHFVGGDLNAESTAAGNALTATAGVNNSMTFVQANLGSSQIAALSVNNETVGGFNGSTLTSTAFGNSANLTGNAVGTMSLQANLNSPQIAITKVANSTFTGSGLTVGATAIGSSLVLTTK